MGVAERIADIEAEIRRMQVNKATMGHLCRLRSRLSQLRRVQIEAATASKGGGGAGEGWEVSKHGDARVIMLGFPSTGKSSFVSAVTNTKSEAAAYEFTTLNCVPGVLEHKGARIQLLDLPGIIEGAAQGKGRGRQVIAVARSADLVVTMLDPTKGDVQRPLIEAEAEAAGLRLNKRPPNVMFNLKKAGGGITYTAAVPQTQLTARMVHAILQEYKIHNAEVVLREDVSVDEFIDVVEGNRVYIPCLFVYNKIDCISIEEVDRLARRPMSVVISCELRLNLHALVERIWRELRLVRVYTKRRGAAPDFDEPIVLRGEARVEHACRAIHRSLADAARFRYALVWGASAKHNPQRVGLTHEMSDEDVVCVVTK